MRRTKFLLFALILGGFSLLLALSPLEEAVKKGDIQRIREYFAQNPKEALAYRTRDFYGYTLLHLAAKYDQLGIAELLIEHGAKVNEKAKFMGKTPLHVAAYYGSWKVLQLLLQKGADVYAKDAGGNTPLHLAADKGKLLCVALLLNGGDKKYLEAKNNLGETPLELAVERGFSEVAVLLTLKGADPNSEDKAGRTPLIYTILKGNKPLFKFFLSHGGYTDFISSAEKRSLLHHAAAVEDVFFAEKILSKEKDKRLLYKGDAYGKTPIDEAWEKENFLVLDLLLCKAPKEVQEQYKWPGFFSEWICQGKIPNNEDLENFDLSWKDKFKRTILHLAVLEKKHKLLDALLSKEVEINARDENGYTPLHYAVIVRDLQAVKLLLDRGANPKIEDKRGRTPLQMAKEKGYKEIFNYIKNKGGEK